jgi:predicted RNA-binding protein with PUA-like domain
MAVFVGVSRQLPLLKSQPGDFHYWCVGGVSMKTKPGDQLLLYFPSNASPTKAGIGQIYQIISHPQSLSSSPCVMYGMSEIKTRLILNLDRHITFRAMKEHPLLQHWGAIRRNMQGVTFAIGDEMWPALRSIIVESNPEADAILEAEPSI